MGIIAEKGKFQNFRLAEAVMAKIEEEELLTLLDMYCNPIQDVLESSRSQILLGSITPADFQAKGVAIPDVLKLPLFSTFLSSANPI